MSLISPNRRKSISDDEFIYMGLISTSDALKHQRDMSSGNVVLREWVHDGYVNAQCESGEENCACVVPVFKCAESGVSDYGENRKAMDIRANCPKKSRLKN